jgi:hypothetical protein
MSRMLVLDDFRMSGSSPEGVAARKAQSASHSDRKLQCSGAAGGGHLIERSGVGQTLHLAAQAPSAPLLSPPLGAMGFRRRGGKPGKGD